MTTDPARTMQIVLDALAEVNSQRGPQEQISDDPAATLFGAAGKLDSLGLVTLLLEIEDRIRQEHNLSLTLADERAMSESRSPFRTLKALADYVDRRISETHGD